MNLWPQTYLYLLRLVFIIASLPSSIVAGETPAMIVYVAFGLFIIFVLNDLVLLTWDGFFYGSIISTVAFQTGESLAVIIVFSVYLATSHQSIITPIYVLPIPASIGLIALNVWAWYRGPKHIWMLGVKEAAANNNLNIRIEPRLSLFGTRRTQEDEVRKVWARKRTALKLTFTRRTVEVETLTYAVARNVTAMILVSALVAQSIRLFMAVIHEDFANQVRWDELGFQINTGSPYIYGEFDQPVQDLSLYVDIRNSTESLADLIQESNKQSFIQWTQAIFINGSHLSLDGDFLNIAIVANPSAVGRIWLGALPGGTFYTDPNPYLWQFINPTQFSVGSNKFGVLDITERRQIAPSFIDMMGFTPDYHSIGLISIRITDESPTDNNTVAQLTLQWDRSITQQENFGPLLYPIIVDYRQHTFLDALSSIGGLLATLQGLHILFFGRPLWWGLFGSKLLNPFGIFGTSFSKSMQERMISRYGYIPNSSDMDHSGARNLGLFLSDFVINVGPLHKRDEDMLNEEEGTVHNRLNEEEGIVHGRHSDEDSFEDDANRTELTEMVRR